MKKIMSIMLLAVIVLFSSCDDDEVITLSAAVLNGGPFTFTVDGTPDMVSGITIATDPTGTTNTFVITDENLEILGLPPTLSALEGVDFDGAGMGVCLIWHLTYEEGLAGAVVGENAGDLAGTFALSNSITVTRNGAVEAAVLAGGSFTFCVDGTADMVSSITIATNPTGTSNTFVVTDENLKILGLPPTLADLEGVNFDGAGAGVCLIWHLTYDGAIGGAMLDANAGDLTGNFALSNSITVTRNAQPTAAVLSGGPYTFTVDGMPDMVSGLTIETNPTGTANTFVITDDNLNILGLPPTLTALEGVDFDAAGTGVCLIWHLTYEGTIEGAMMNANAANLSGCFELSNSIMVTRN